MYASHSCPDSNMHVFTTVIVPKVSRSPGCHLPTNSVTECDLRRSQASAPPGDPGDAGDSPRSGNQWSPGRPPTHSQPKPGGSGASGERPGPRVTRTTVETPAAVAAGGRRHPQKAAAGCPPCPQPGPGHPTPTGRLPGILRKLGTRGKKKSSRDVGTINGAFEAD